MGVTEERVWAVEKRAIKLLRESGGGEQLSAAEKEKQEVEEET